MASSMDIVFQGQGSLTGPQTVISDEVDVTGYTSLVGAVTVTSFAGGVNLTVIVQSSMDRRAWVNLAAPLVLAAPGTLNFVFSVMNGNPLGKYVRVQQDLAGPGIVVTYAVYGVARG